jgi:hypothetical protein
MPRGETRVGAAVKRDDGVMAIRSLNAFITI